jgi:hypothetical protein
MVWPPSSRPLPSRPWTAGGCGRREGLGPGPVSAFLLCRVWLQSSRVDSFRSVGAFVWAQPGLPLRRPLAATAAGLGVADAGLCARDGEPACPHPPIAPGEGNGLHHRGVAVEVWPVFWGSHRCGHRHPLLMHRQGGVDGLQASKPPWRRRSPGRWL